MGTINEPIRDFTAEQAQEYLNKSKLAKQMGRFFGPFKGMSVEAATEAARGYIKALKEHGKPRKEDAHFSLLANRLLQELNNG